MREAVISMEAQKALMRLLENCDRVIVGKQTTKELLVTAFAAGGHASLIDVPGSGKTMLARTLAASVGGTFQRIQFTPDLLPTDITGLSVYNQKTKAFEFHRGPIFANVVLADEINRATPKTQSAALQPMGEGLVTVDLVTYRVPEPFMLIATQNPVEYEGTFPLPEAQLDRFMLEISMGYADRNEMMEIMRRVEKTHPIENVEPVIMPEDVVALQRFVREDIYCSDAIRAYIADIVAVTRQDKASLTLGASDRAPGMMQQAAKAYALLQGSNFVAPEHVRAVAPAVLAHRVILSVTESRVAGLLGKHWRAVEIIEELVQGVPVPGARHEPAQ